MRSFKRTLPGFLLLAAMSLVAQTNNGAPRPRRQPQSKAASAEHESRGQQVFEQNCSRCHNAPEGFPQQISGTIARHMRVRASLSEADYKALLRFFNP